MAEPIPAGRHEPLVYFIRNGNRVKIGYTTHLAARITSLSLSPRFVALTLDGDRELETTLHRKFAAERVEGTEWFVYSRRLRDYIDSRTTVTEEELLEEAERHVLDTQMASASMLQRRMSIGFARAQRLMEKLEQRGVVGPLAYRGSSRAVLIRRPVEVPA